MVVAGDPAQPRLKIAIVGSGIAGNTAAYLLREQHDITVFEAAGYVGGHSNTVDVDTDAGRLAIDTGFIVFNDRTYPQFNRLLAELGQAWQPSVMSFSVQSRAQNLEYNGGSLATLFAQRRNLLRPTFLRMLRDILRFNAAAEALLERGADGSSVAGMLREGNYSEAFARFYLLPMAAAIWSADPEQVRDMPAYFLLRFFQQHGLLQLQDRPSWRVIKGGSREYVSRLVAGHRNRIRLNAAVRSVEPRANGVYVKSDSYDEERYDRVVMACHSDQALALRQQPTTLEQRVLGAIRYQRNEAILHRDRSLMPRRRKAWAAWNYRLPQDGRKAATVTYNMNILQSLPGPETFLVTLNDSEAIATDSVIQRFSYEHPLFNSAAVAAQKRHAELNLSAPIVYCGAYWRNGFHEDGVVSAIDAVRHLREGHEHAKLHLRRAG